MTQASSEELPRLGRYQVINKIAAGGMAEVFLAKAVGAMGFQRLVAVKLIHANFTRDQEFVKMFIDEARIAMHLHHRNIVQVFDLDKTDDTYFIAMEFVHGVNLYDLYERIASKNRWIEPSMALYLVAEISKGLHFAHTRKSPEGRPLGIVHRDISPQNVLLSFEGEVKITDFGIATAAERLHQTAAGIVKGKYAYMAPERLQEQPTDGRVDVFSTGVLLYELLVGENPFAGTSAVDTIENVLGKKIQAPSERGAQISTQLDRITMKALARNPAERYSTAQDLGDAVTEYALELTHARKDMAAGDGALAALLAELFPEKAKRPPFSAEPRSISLPGLSAASGVKVDTVDTSPEPSAMPRFHSSNGQGGDFERTEELGTHEEAPAGEIGSARDPASTEEPTLLRMTPLSDKDAIGLPNSAAPRLPSVKTDEARTAREMSGIQESDSTGGYEPLDPFPTREDRLELDGGAPRMWPKGTETPIAPIADDIDKTAPTELPPVPSARKPTAPPRKGSTTDPSGPPDMEDPFAATLPSTSGLVTLEDGASSVGSSPPSFSSQPTRPPTGSGVPRDNARASSTSGDPPSSGASLDGQFQPLVIPVPGPLEVSQPASGGALRSQHSTTIIASLLLVIAALVVLAAVLVVRNRQPQTRATPVALKVTSNPPGATVTVNGQVQKGVTPMDGAVLAYEEHTIAVALEGFAETPPKVIRPLGPAIVNFDLAPLIRVGSISVRTTPPDARVFVNDQERGTGTVNVEHLPIGQEITVRVEASGYRTFEQKITLLAETPDVTMPIALTKGRNSAAPRSEVRTRKVTLAMYQDWAVVYYKNQLLGTTPVAATLPIGAVQLRLVNEEAKLDKTITITVPESGPAQITLSPR